MAVDLYRHVQDRVGAACAASGRDRAELTLVVVTKGRDADAIRQVYDTGHRDFGENRAAEMSEKAEMLPKDIRWHFVGALQSRKARVVRSSTHLLHSLDRESLAKAWLKGIGEPPPVLIQVNIGREEQKGGVAPEDTLAMVERAAGIGLDVRGLMCIPPLADDAEASRPYFVELRELRDRVVAEVLPAATGLSMGMTNDYEVAIAEGASFIRVGRAIFDPTIS